MNLIELITGRSVNQFAKNLVQELIKRYPPAMEQGESRKISAKGIANILEGIVGKAVDFQNKEGLGMLGKARLGNAFKWGLKDAGYSKEFIELATEALVVHLTCKPHNDSQADKWKKD